MTSTRWRPLDANSRRQGRSRSLGQVIVRWRFVGGVPGRWRCCTCVLYRLPVRPEQAIGQGLTQAAVSLTWKRLGLTPQTVGAWARAGWLKMREDGLRYLTDEGRNVLASKRQEL